MAISGPVTNDTSSLAIGLMQIRVGASAANISSVHPVLASSDSVGALTKSTFISEVEYWEHESGFPFLKDYVIAIRENARLEGEMEELTPLNLAIARGKDIAAAPQTTFTAHSGEVLLGDRATTAAAPSYIRMEGRYTYPDGVHYMDVIFPRAQVKSSIEVDLQREDNVKVPVTFEAQRADSDVSGGSSVWDDKPLGWIKFT